MNGKVSSEEMTLNKSKGVPSVGQGRRQNLRVQVQVGGRCGMLNSSFSGFCL